MCVCVFQWSSKVIVPFVSQELKQLSLVTKEKMQCETRRVQKERREKGGRRKSQARQTDRGNVKKLGRDRKKRGNPVAH